MKSEDVEADAAECNANNVEGTRDAMCCFIQLLIGNSVAESG